MKILSKKIDEFGLLIFLLVTSGAMLAATFQYPYEAAMFPRFAAILVFVGSLLILLEQYLPQSIQEIVGESTQLIGDQEVEVEGKEFEGQKNPDNNTDTPTTDSGQLGLLNDSAKTTYAIVLYAVGSFLVGMLWVTPVFVFAYIMLFRGSRLIAAVLSAVSFGIGFIFMDLLNVPIDTGLII